MIPVGMVDVLESCLVTVCAGFVLRQEVPLQFVFQQHVILWREA